MRCWQEVIRSVENSRKLLEALWNQDAEAVAEEAIEQIKNRKYVETLKDYKGNLLLVGINYDKNSKEHSCVIEKVEI